MQRYSNKLLGSRLRQARKAAGLTQSALALRAGGFPYQVLSYLERGRQGTSAERIAALAVALGVSSDWLLGLRDNENGIPHNNPAAG